MNEKYTVTGTLAEAPIIEHPTIKGIRNKRHRKRTIKKYRRMGITSYEKPVITWEKQEFAQ